MIDQIFEKQFLGNTWEQWIVAASVFAGVLFFCLALKSILMARLRKFAPTTAVIWDDLALLLLDRTRLVFLCLLALHAAVPTLNLHPKVFQVAHVTFFLVLFLQLGLWAHQALRFTGDHYANQSISTDASKATTIRALMVLGEIMVWLLVVVLLLDNWGVKVAPFVAGLGIGGIAIALAVQNILGDLFSSLSIVLDKPFVIGDTIAVGDENGTVEYIGLKSTRVKSSSGELMIFSNSDLLRSRSRNFKRMWERRVLFSFGLVYETPSAKLHQVREILRDAVNAQKQARFERCHLKTFAASSLDFEVVYWVTSPEYSVYVDVHHGVSVALLEAFRKEGIEFAYPTQLQLEAKNAPQFQTPRP